MPANLPPEYFAAEKRFKEASTPREKTAALEENTDLKFKDKLHTSFFNTWSFQSFGCSAKETYISSATCSQIVSKVK